MQEAKRNNIAIVWDFDQTLCPIDSTTKTYELLEDGKPGSEFWAYIHSLKGTKENTDWEHLLAEDAPIWMYSLSRLAFDKKVPLNSEFFQQFVLKHIPLFPNVIPFMEAIKAIGEQERFKKVNLDIHHFIVSAGLKDLIELVFPPDLITYTFGCRYVVTAHKDQPDAPESIPVFCMDQTMKTRSMFEISKGSFTDKTRAVNSRVEPSDLWAPFKNVIYVGDGPTDVPALSLTRYNGGTGIVVYDPNKKQDVIEKRLKDMRLDKRADLITPADFEFHEELYLYLENKCIQICQRYEAEQAVV